MALAKREKRTAVERMAAQDRAAAEVISLTPPVLEVEPVPVRLVPPTDPPPVPESSTGSGLVDDEQTVQTTKQQQKAPRKSRERTPGSDALAALGLPSRAVRSLTNAGVTVERLRDLSDLELAAVPGLGADMLVAVRSVVPTPPPQPLTADRSAVNLAAAQEKQRAILRALRQQRRPQATVKQGRPGAHAKPNLRQKRLVHIITTAEDGETLTAVWMAYRDAYADHHRARDRSTPWALTKSNVAVGALAHALDHAKDWILGSENDGRIEPGALVGVETEKVAMLLPTVLVDRLAAVMDDWQDRYIEHRQHAAAVAGLRAGRYRLTREPVLRAALRFSLQTPEAWVLTCPNDDRHAPLAAGDRRTDPTTWVRQTSLPADA